MMKKELTIYFDMDGVLADFDKDCKALQHLADQPWLDIPGFFRRLEPIGNPKYTISMLQTLGYDVKILSALDMRGEVGQARANDKINWVKEHIPCLSCKDIILVPYGENKTDYVKTPMDKSVLIDDYKVNLHKWQEQGGIAVKFGRIHKTHRPYRQITNLTDIVSLVMELGA